MAIKRIPYDINDFWRIVEGNYYYVDKTCFIERIEQVSSARVKNVGRERGRNGKKVYICSLIL